MNYENIVSKRSQKSVCRWRGGGAIDRKRKFGEDRNVLYLVLAVV